MPRVCRWGNGDQKWIGRRELTGVMKMFQNWFRVMVAQLANFMKNCRWVSYRVSYRGCKIYFNKVEEIKMKRSLTCKGEMEPQWFAAYSVIVSCEVETNFLNTWLTSMKLRCFIHEMRTRNNIYFIGLSYQLRKFTNKTMCRI